MRQLDQAGDRANDWHHWLYLHREEHPKKSEIAERLGISSADFSKRLDPDRYQPAVSDREIAITAEMWNQSTSYVRKLYPREAA